MMSELKYSCQICGRYMNQPCHHWQAWIAEPQPTQPVVTLGEGPLTPRGEDLEQQIRELQIAVLLLAQTRAPNLKADWGDYAEAIEAIRKRVEGHEEEGKYGLRQRK